MPQRSQQLLGGPRGELPHNAQFALANLVCKLKTLCSLHMHDTSIALVMAMQHSELCHQIGGCVQDTQLAAFPAL